MKVQASKEETQTPISFTPREVAGVGLMRDCEKPAFFFFVVLHLVPMLFSRLLMSIKTLNPSKRLSFLQDGRHSEGFLAAKIKNKPKQTSNGFLRKTGI